MPGSLLERYLPVPGRSVPFSCVTQNCSGSRAAMASGSFRYRLMRRSPVVWRLAITWVRLAGFQNQIFASSPIRRQDRARSRSSDQDLSSDASTTLSGGDPGPPCRLDGDLGLQKHLAPLGLSGAKRAAGLHMNILGTR